MFFWEHGYMKKKEDDSPSLLPDHTASHTRVRRRSEHDDSIATKMLLLLYFSSLLREQFH